MISRKDFYENELALMPSTITYQGVEYDRPGKTMQQIMRKKNITIKALAQDTKISIKEIREVYHDRLFPTNNFCRKVSIALGEDKDFLYNCRYNYLFYCYKSLSSKYNILGFN